MTGARFGAYRPLGGQDGDCLTGIIWRGRVPQFAAVIADAQRHQWYQMSARLAKAGQATGVLGPLGDERNITELR